MKNQKKQPPASGKNNVKVTDAKMFAPLTTKTPTQTKKSIVPTAKPKAKQKPMPDTSNKTKNRQRITSNRGTIKGGSIEISPIDKKMTTVSTSSDTVRTAYPERTSPSGRKFQLTKVTYNKK
jgi:hypothetical protein